MSGDANLGPWSITPEDWPSKNEKAKSIAAQYYLQEPTITSPINSAEETPELIKVELNKSIPTIMENNTVNLEDMTAPIVEEEVTVEETLTTDEPIIIETEEEASALVRFWRFMNKPIYVRTWFGFSAPGAKAE